MKRCCKNCPHSQRAVDGTYWCNEKPKKPRRVLATYYDAEESMSCKYCTDGNKADCS
jgi:hypothetical protein